MRSLAALLGVPTAVPDFSTLSRRGEGLTLHAACKTDLSGLIHLVVDSTDLKVFGEGEWLEKKHKTKRKRRSWRKLHLGLNLVSGDPTALPGLLDQVDGPVDLFLADGAYDGSPTRNVLAARFGSTIEVTIPPPRNAILSSDAAKDPTPLDWHIASIATCGRVAWQKATGYNQRSRGETLMGRWKTVIAPKLKAHNFANQKTETKIGVRVLKRMTGLGRPSFERTA